MKSYSDYYITPEEYERAEEFGVSRDTLNTRIRKLDWDKERAITTIPYGKNKYGGWHKVADENGISQQTFYDRVTNGRMTPEEAATTKKSRGRDQVIPQEYFDLAIASGVKEATFLSRYYRGVDPYLAATTPPRTKGEKSKWRNTISAKQKITNSQSVESK